MSSGVTMVLVVFIRICGIVLNCLRSCPLYRVVCWEQVSMIIINKLALKWQPQPGPWNKLNSLLQSLPPIRNQSNRKKKKTQKQQPSTSNKDNVSKGEARISSYDYRSWDKFDVVSFWCLMHSTLYNLESHGNLIFISLKADWSLGLPSVTTDVFLHFQRRPIWLTQCCTQFKSCEVKILCVLYLHYIVAYFTFKWYGNSRNKTVYSQRVWIGYNIDLAK